VAIVTDANVARDQADLLAHLGRDIPRIEVDPGETSKSLAVYGRVLDFLAEQRLDRGGLVMAIGGGVVGDLGGFAAASYLRGIDVIQVPTSLLAMVDSSVGGKTGINLAAGKNLVGAFHQPRQVFIGMDTLATLPQRQFAAGMAEVIKNGLLGNASLFEELEAGPPLTASSPSLGSVVLRCCADKARIVKADERELAATGGRALLNLGHTFAHAIERVAGYGSYLHGEAVAVGLVGAARLSVDLGLIDAGVVSRVETVLLKHDLPIRLSRPLEVDALIDAMQRDKKVRAGMPRFVVLKAIGEAETLDGVDVDLVAKTWRQLGAEVIPQRENN
jgi:3-dehydroquinate synthase